MLWRSRSDLVKREKETIKHDKGYVHGWKML